MIQRILNLTLLVFSLASIAHGQEASRLVDWQPVVPLSEAKTLEIVGITVNDANVTAGQIFNAPDSWLDKLSFRIRNVSDKTITLFGFGIGFPEVDLGGGRTAMLSIGYDAEKNSEKRQPIPSGSEVEVSLPPEQLALLRQVAAKLIGTTRLTRSNILPGLVNFGDGTKIGCISLRKS